MDVETTFLNGFLKEELYMMQPGGFVDPKGANKVCKAPVIHFWAGASISELEYTLWWGDQSIWFYTDLRWSLYLQESEWEHYNISDKYMWMTYFWLEMM